MGNKLGRRGRKLADVIFQTKGIQTAYITAYMSIIFQGKRLHDELNSEDDVDKNIFVVSQRWNWNLENLNNICLFLIFFMSKKCSHESGNIIGRSGKWDRVKTVYCL